MPLTDDIAGLGDEAAAHPSAGGGVDLVARKGDLLVIIVTTASRDQAIALARLLFSANLDSRGS